MIYFLSFSYNKIKESAYEMIQSHFARSAGEEPNSPMPPTYFKLGQLYEINEDKQGIHITLGNSMLVVNTGHGVAVNKRAARILLNLYGIKSPDFHCVAHIASGVVKHMTTSKTMNVPEITILYDTLRTVIKHFEASIKNKEILDQALENLQLSKICLIS